MDALEVISGSFVLKAAFLGRTYIISKLLGKMVKKTMR